MEGESFINKGRLEAFTDEIAAIAETIAVKRLPILLDIKMISFDIDSTVMI